MKDLKSYSFEIYTKHPLTGETGWDIQFVNVFAEDMNEARILLKSIPDFDCIILFNHECELNEFDIAQWAEGVNYRITTGYPHYS
jgi:hypothetical protein